MPTKEQLEALLRNDPEDVFLNYGLAMALLKEGREDDALDSFDRAIELDEGYVAAYFHKGRLLMNLGRSDEARATLTRGLSAAKQASNEQSAGEISELLAELGD